MPPRPPVRAAIVAAFAYLAIAVWWSAPASLSPADTLPDLGDPVHLSYVMAWVAHQIVRNPLRLFDSNSFFPYPRSLTFGDHLIPEALMVAPINWLTGNAVLASNVGVLLALTLSALAMFLLVRRLLESEPAAFIAGLAYAFNSFTRHELPRVHVLNIQWWPLALLFLDRLVRSGKAREAWGFVASLVLAGLSGTYYLVYTAIVAPLWLALAFRGEGRWPRRSEVRAIAWALVVLSVPVVAVIAPYALLMADMGFEKGLEPGVDVLSYLAPVGANRVWGWLSPEGIRGTGSHFGGYLSMTLAAAGCGLRPAPRATALRAMALVTALAGFAFSLGWSIRFAGQALMPGPYRLLYLLFPPARGMAGSERFGVLVIFGGAILIGLGVAGLLARAAGGRARFVLCLVLAIALPLEHWSPALPGAPIPTGQDVPRAFGWLAADSTEPLVELPLYPDAARRLWSLYLNASTYHWRPIPFGRTSFYPPIHDLLAWYLRDFPDDSSIALLGQLGIRTVVVHPRQWTEGGERERRLAALEGNQRLDLVQQFEDAPPARYTDLGLGSERIYRIRPAPSPLTPPCAPLDEVPRAGWVASSNVGDPAAALDGDRRTAWRTGRPQRPDDSFEIDLPRSETIAVASLDIHYPQGEFARALRLRVWEGDRWVRIWFQDGPSERWGTIRELLERPKEARLLLRFEPRSVKRLRLSLGSEYDNSWLAWAIPEIRLYRQCR